MLLSDTANNIRSRNAGPFCLTKDIFFADAASYELARASTLTTVAGIARAYGVDGSSVKGVWWDDRRAVSWCDGGVRDPAHIGVRRSARTGAAGADVRPTGSG